MSSPIALSDLCYVEFSAGGDDATFAIEKVWRCIHSYGREHGMVLGFDFPDWQPETSFAKPTRIRVFGEKDPLAAFIRQPRALRLLETGDVSRSAIANVPERLTYASIRRDSSADKTKPSHAARRLRRGAGEFTGKSATHQFSIVTNSKSTEMSFRLTMKKIASSRPASVIFGGYGMCHEGALPQF